MPTESKTRPECLCGKPYFHNEHLLSCPVKTRQLWGNGEIEVWFDRWNRRFVTIYLGEEVGEFSWGEMMEGTDIPHLSDCGKHVHTRSSCSSRFPCLCRGTSSEGCPTHQWYRYPTHKACRGDGCEECNFIGYMRAPHDFEINMGFLPKGEMVPLKDSRRRSRFGRLLSWRFTGRETAEELADSLSVENLTYEETPERLARDVTAFRHLRQDARVSACRTFLRMSK